MSEASNARSRKWFHSEKGKAYKKAYYQSQKERWQKYERNRQLKKMYGITIEDYERMLAAQNGQCKMCGATSGGPRRSTFMVDHCHNTGKVRGLLCIECNIAVGFYEKHAESVKKYLAGP